MTSRRETILAALYAAAQTIPLATGEEITFERNRPEEVADSMLPAILMYDGDESEPQAPMRTPARGAPCILVMETEFWGYVQAKPADIGTELNDLRARLIKAIWTDDAFMNAVGLETVTLGPVTTGLGKGKKAIGGFGMPIRITYSFNPRDP